MEEFVMIAVREAFNIGIGDRIVSDCLKRFVSDEEWGSIENAFRGKVPDDLKVMLSASHVDGHHVIRFYQVDDRVFWFRADDEFCVVLDNMMPVEEFVSFVREHFPDGVPMSASYWDLDYAVHHEMKHE